MSIENYLNKYTNFKNNDILIFYKLKREIIMTKLENITENNKYIIENLNKQTPEALITLSEDSYHNQIFEMVNSFIKNKDKKFILLSGPSSSGKTTTSHIIEERLEAKGYTTKVISLDDFFIDRDLTPVLPNGDKDFDSINSIDWKLFEKCMRELLTKKSSVLPVYDFIEGQKRFNNPPTTLLEHEIIIIEGLHALNPLLNSFIPNEFSIKVFVCPKKSFVSKDGFELDIFDLRLIRRLIRDVRTRGISPENTLKFWKNVRSAENQYVLPFEEDADYIIDSTHAYEPLVYKSILIKLLVHHSKYVRVLVEKLERFNEIRPNKVPETSLLEEFVG
jgi:uridine kinase